MPEAVPPWRTLLAGYGVRPGARLHPLPRIFKGQRELTGRRRNRDAFQGAGPSLGANPFQGGPALHKERELSPGLPPASPGSVALPHWTPPPPHRGGGGRRDPTSAGAPRPSPSLRHRVSRRVPPTRARVRLLGPCFKTGRVGHRH
uniref:Uncharacterized protein n=1 Tax=Xenopus tropicalis TaxID=8364 RepID=A0A803KE56_XENTR